MSFLGSRKTLFRQKSEWKKITISLILAIIFWFSISRLSYVEKRIILPVSYKNLPSNFIIMNGIESNVALVVRAREDFFKNSNLSNLIRPIVYLDNAKVGNFSYPIDIILNTPVQDVSVKLLKNEVKLSIDEITERELEIKPHLTGIPGKGYFVDDVIMDLSKIKVVGPKSVILTQNSILTLQISVEGLTNNLYTNTFLILPEFTYTHEPTNLNIEVVIKPLAF